MRKVILYFEKADGLRRLAEEQIKRNLPGYEVITSGGEKNNIKTLIKKAGGIENIVAVCTPEVLLQGKEGGQKITDELKKEGYKGKIIYTGFNNLPEESRFYDLKARKIGPSLIAKIRQAIY